MKKIYLLFAGLFLIGSTFAQSSQITNSGFENWSSSKKITAWTSTNDIIGALVSSFQNVFKDSVVKKGNYSARLKCTSIMGTAVPGIITNGSYPTGSLSTSFNPNLIRPVRWIYNERPDSLTGWYKYTRQGNDTGTIGIRFFKNQTLIGEGKFFALASNSSLTAFTTVISWTSSQMPDSMYVLASTGGVSSNTDGSELNVDNLGFIGLTRIKNINSTSLAITPNPANNIFKVKSINNKPVQVVLYNMLGAEVLKTQTDGEWINIEHLSSGIYVVQLTSDQEEKTSIRLVKE